MLPRLAEALDPLPGTLKSAPGPEEDLARLRSLWCHANYEDAYNTVISCDYLTSSSSRPSGFFGDGGF